MMVASRQITQADVTSPNGPFTWKGADGSTQFSIGATNSSVEYVEADGGITGAGGSLISRNAAQTGNVPLNLTAQGAANVNFANSGSGQLAQGVDPGAPVSSGGPVQLTPSISSGPVKIGNATYGVNLDGGSAAICLVAGRPLASNFPGYVAGNWYVPVGPQRVAAAPTAPGSGSIRLYPAYIMQKVTLNTIGLRVQTLSASGNVQAAIYAHNYATGKPTGNPLISTGSMSTSAAAAVSSAASVQLNPGLYWFATNCDNVTAAFASLDPGALWVGQVIGSTIQGDDLSSTQSFVGYSVTQTFGTWPDLTAGSFSDVTSATMPVVQVKIASVP